MPEAIDDLLGTILGPKLGYSSTFPAEALRYVRRRAAEAGVEPLAWLRTIESRPFDLRDLIAAATVPHTAFFRHAEQIARFRAVLPTLAARSKPVPRRCHDRAARRCYDNAILHAEPADAERGRGCHADGGGLRRL